MAYIRRELEKKINKHLKSKEIIAVVGPRQSGKTTMIQSILKGLNAKMISFDDAKELSLFENDIDSFIEKNVKGYKLLFIDEIQYSKDCGKKLKYVYDMYHIKMIISGSSAAQISIQSLKYLVGRIFIFCLYPFSFKEFLSAKDERLAAIQEKGMFKEEMQKELSKHLHEYLTYGGYPKVVLSKTLEEKKVVLQNIYSTYLLREIKEIFQLPENYKMMNLMKILSLQIGGLINYNELCNATGFSFAELKRYLQILEDTYICKRVLPYYQNKRTELVKNPKIYFYDMGLRNICIDNFSKERTEQGAIYENFVFEELNCMGKEAKFWRTKSGAEMDFVVESKTVVGIEVKSQVGSEIVTKSVYSFIEKYGPKKVYILSLDYQSNKRIDGTNILYIPFAKINKLDLD